MKPAVLASGRTGEADAQIPQTSRCSWQLNYIGLGLGSCIESGWQKIEPLGSWEIAL